MAFLTSLLAAVVLAAPGDIYRCIGPDGKAGFQDKPCAGQGADRKANRLKAGTAGATDQRELREWLQQLRGQTRPRVPAGSSDVAPPERSFNGVAMPATADEALLAACSGRFLDCASDDAALMDACIARSPVCRPGVGSGCCPAACVTRYRTHRAAGLPLATAVQRALLDPSEPSCAAR